MEEEKYVQYDRIGERIRNRRRELRLTQEALAERANISVSFVGHLERAEKIPSVNTLARICDSMQVSLDYIVFGRKRVCDRESCPIYADIQGIIGAYK